MTLPPTASQRLNEEGFALCQVMRDIHRRGWCEGTGGNFSSLLCSEPLSLLMAPSGVNKGDLQPEDLIVVDRAAQVISGTGRASAETLLHLTILANTQATSVLHTHSQAATLLSRHPDTATLPEVEIFPPAPPGSAASVPPDGAPWPALLGYLLLNDLEMLKGLEGIRTHHCTIAIPILANCQDMQLLSQAAQPHLAQAPYGLLIAGHGLYVWGDSLFQACRHLEILEFLLEQHWRQHLFNALRNNPTPRA
jgi:methylthioribulose-1-phosphate dehydratase